MSTSRAPQLLAGYVAELARLRRVPLDQFDDEADRLAPIWVTVKLAPAP